MYLTKGTKNYLRKQIMTLLCNDIFCKKDDGKIEDLPNLTMDFQDFKVEFTPSEYLYLDKDDTYQIRVGNFNGIKKESYCKNYTRALGGFALSKINLTVELAGSKSVNLIIYDKEKPNP